MHRAASGVLPKMPVQSSDTY
ncbi:LITAF domain-containing protein [Caenorhabditis elegans]|uniref:LITAF domain-containing protein n=1 Tax=Caenorhabditis elegans TaxID=6239 RepID=A0A0K3AV78_CAEEL|nr:LITAF domain-containing protein [Caenorhabditis elegans]CTQ86712.1 LITAF domain-containing protein [Caenorhabditis elegans]|eukprot:NP_001300013.1 Uncharacterized protein CELE_B0348.2 [Caenorhabditis elegans]